MIAEACEVRGETFDIAFVKSVCSHWRAALGVVLSTRSLLVVTLGSGAPSHKLDFTAAATAAAAAAAAAAGYLACYESLSYLVYPCGACSMVGTPVVCLWLAE
jgi:hypothetical protein